MLKVELALFHRNCIGSVNCLADDIHRTSHIAHCSLEKAVERA